MSVQQPLRRGMSYRKPVPTYIPSPPPSPRPASPYNRQSLSIESTFYDEMPPLPSGWRDAIDKATSKDKRTFGSVMADVDGGGRCRTPSFHGGASRREQVSSPWMNDESDYYSISYHGDEALAAPNMSPRSWAQSPHTKQRRTLPLDYRPPTPPLSAYVKQEQLPHEGPIPSMDYHMIYPDPPSVLDLDWILPRNITDEHTSNAGRADLIPSAPFQSEGTQLFSVTRRLSSSTRANVPISDAREMWLRDTWCILPVLSNDPEDQHLQEKEWQSPQGSNQARRFWERLAMLGNLLRGRLRSFRAPPLSNCDCDSSISSM